MQLIEGIGNEVTISFLCATSVIAVCLYKLINQWQPNQAIFNTFNWQQSTPQQHVPAPESTQNASGPGPTAPAPPGTPPVQSIYELGRRGSYEEPQSGAIEITVKYRESCRVVFMPESRTLLDLKRYCFHKVLDEGKRVHMVYQGHLLRPDTAPLAEFTLDNPSTVICQISQSVSSANTNVNPEGVNNTEFDVSGILLPLCGLILLGCWVVAMTVTSTVSGNVYVALLLLSVLYVIALVSSIT